MINFHIHAKYRGHDWEFVRTVRAEDVGGGIREAGEWIPTLQRDVADRPLELVELRWDDGAHKKVVWRGQ